MKIMPMDHVSDIHPFLKMYADAINEEMVMEKMQAVFSHTSCQGVLAMEEDTVVAVALYAWDEPRIIGCLVLPTYEGQQIEKTLIDKVVHILREGGASRIQGGFLMNHPGVHIPIRDELQTLGFTTAEELEMAVSLSDCKISSATLDPPYSLDFYSPSYKQDMITIKYEGNKGDTGNPLVQGVKSRKETEQEVERILSGTFGAFLPQASLMLLHENEPVGCSTCIKRSDGIAIVTNITILPAYRNLGLGKGLMRESLYRLQQLGVSRVQLSVVGSNEAAMNIYTELGFGEIARICYYRWVNNAE